MFAFRLGRGMKPKKHRFVQILHKIRPPPRLKNVKQYLKGDPYYSLHISEVRGRTPPRECTKLAFLVKLYTTQPFVLTLVTWVTQIRLAFSHSARRLAIGSPALGQTKSYSVQPCLPLAAMIGHAGRLLVFSY